MKKYMKAGNSGMRCRLRNIMCTKCFPLFAIGRHPNAKLGAFSASDMLHLGTDSKTGKHKCN